VDGFLHCPGKSLEQSLDLVMGIPFAYLHIEIAFAGIAEGFEKMLDHLGGKGSHIFTVERDIPDKIGPSGKIEGYLGEYFIHREQLKAVAGNPPFVTEGFVHGLAQGKADILDGMVFVHDQIAASVQV
jgi:hypothetical protein